MHAAIASLVSQTPLLQDFAPVRRLLQSSSRPFRATRTGKIYLGNGQPVIVCPTFRKGPEHTAAFRATLGEAGFSPYDWGLGFDMGPGSIRLSSCLRRLEERVIDVVEAQGQPVSLVGWGLSGIYAREVGKRVSPLVRQVITLGTPFNLAADPTRSCIMLRALDGDSSRLEHTVRERLRQRPPVPCTSIFSQNDDIVPWKLSVEPESHTSENVGVAGLKHGDLISHPKVLEIVTHRLSQPDDAWRAYPG